MKTKPLAVKVDEGLLHDIDQIAQYRRLSRPRLVQWLLEEAVKDGLLDLAADLYARGEVTTERAAELAGVTLWEFMDYLQEHDIPSQRGAREIRRDANALLERYGYRDLAAKVDVH